MLGGAASAKTANYTLVAADAGTAISMTSASATTITVNTALFAAGDTVHITNLGAGVCTITAGTATVNSSASLALAQYESGFLDFTSTSAAIFVKGAGAAPASSSGMTFISRTTFSATSALTLDSLFSDTYENYYVTFSCHGSSSAEAIRMQGRYSTTTYTGAFHEYAYAGFNTGNTADNMRGTVATSFFINHIQVSSLPNLTTMWFYRDQTSNKLRYTLIMWDQRFSAARMGGGIIENNQTWTGLYIFPDAGTMTGTVTVYGLAKA
jgi:hypothetical protein